MDAQHQPICEHNNLQTRDAISQYFLCMDDYFLTYIQSRYHDDFLLVSLQMDEAVTSEIHSRHDGMTSQPFHRQ